MCAIAIGYLIVCLRTGKTPNRSFGINTREDDPISYWVSIGFIALTAVLGAALGFSHPLLRAFT